MKIFAFMLLAANGVKPQLCKFNSQETAIGILRETEHCWYLSDAPEGFPDRFNKGEEYLLQRNRHGFYMFGRDMAKLALSWNRAVGVAS